LLEPVGDVRVRVGEVADDLEDVTRGAGRETSCSRPRPATAARVPAGLRDRIDGDTGFPEHQIKGLRCRDEQLAAGDLAGIDARNRAAVAISSTPDALGMSF
jgi:hypothetical protein